MSPVNWNDLPNITDFSLWWNDKISKAKKCPNSANVLNLTVVIMGNIWKARNAWTFTNELTDPPDIVAKALFEYNEFLDVMLTNSAVDNSQENYESQLKMPKDGIYLFVDAGLQIQPKKASVSLVAMDSNGVLLRAHGSPIQYVGNSMIAEAFVIRKAVENAIQHGWKNTNAVRESSYMLGV